MSSLDCSHDFLQNDPIHNLLSHWWTIHGNVDETNLPLAKEICERLRHQKLYTELDVFLESLPCHEAYTTNEIIVRAQIAVALERKKDFALVYRLIQTNDFQNGEDLINMWDKAHYLEEELRLGRTLTPLERFRIRERNVLPESICPSRERRKVSFPKRSRKVLQEWFKENSEDPYPSPEVKRWLAGEADLSLKQVRTWFANARRRNGGGGNCKKFKSPRYTFHEVKPPTTQTSPKKKALSDYNQDLSKTRPEKNVADKMWQDHQGENKENLNMDEEETLSTTEHVLTAPLPPGDEPLDHKVLRGSPFVNFVDGKTRNKLQRSTVFDLTRPPSHDLVLPALVNTCPFLYGLRHRSHDQEYVTSFPFALPFLPCPGLIMDCEGPIRAGSIPNHHDQLILPPITSLIQSFGDPDGKHEPFLFRPDHQPWCPLYGGSIMTPASHVCSSPGNLSRITAATALLDMSSLTTTQDS